MKENKEIEVKNELIEEPVEEMVSISKEEFNDIANALKDGHEKLIESNKINEELNDKYLRALADYQNLQRISTVRISNSKRDGKISVLKNLIPIIDDFERAIEAGEVTDGIKLIYDSLILLFKNVGVETINPSIGDAFDDLTQEAVIPIAASEENVKNTVGIVQQKGYKLEDVIIRYAKVGVYV